MALVLRDGPSKVLIGEPTLSAESRDERGTTWVLMVLELESAMANATNDA
jgi:hypothetical protein